MAARLLVVAAIVLVVVGGTARFVHLGRLFYFHDEAATSLRLSGRTAADYRRFAAGHLVTARQIARFQTANRGLGSTVRSLATDDPQHPPLFFVLARLWAVTFGSSVVALRALAAVLGLLELAAAGWLVQLLFGSRTTTLVAVALLAISPFQILYSDIAREYSLWLAAVAASGAALVTAARHGSTRWWATYALLLAVALYSFPNTLFVIGGHALFVLLGARGSLRRFAFSAGAAVVAFLPWLAVMALERGAFEAGTSWTGENVPFSTLLRSWLVVAGVGVADHPHGPLRLDTASTLLYGFVLVVELAALWALQARGPRAAWLFVATTIVATAAPLVAADLIAGGIRSTVPRFLAPMYLALAIAIAFLICEGLRQAQPLRRAAVAALAVAVVAAAAGSYARRAHATVWWTQDDGAAAENRAVAQRVNSLPRPLLISTGLGTLLELSHYLRPETRIRVVVDGREPPLPRKVRQILVYGSPANGAAAARLSALLRDVRRRGRFSAEPISPALGCCSAGIRPIPRQLWRLERRR